MNAQNLQMRRTSAQRGDTSRDWKSARTRDSMSSVASVRMGGLGRGEMGMIRIEENT